VTRVYPCEAPIRSEWRTSQGDGRPDCCRRQARLKSKLTTLSLEDVRAVERAIRVQLASQPYRPAWFRRVTPFLPGKLAGFSCVRSRKLPRRRRPAIRPTRRTCSRIPVRRPSVWLHFWCFSSPSSSTAHRPRPGGTCTPSRRTALPFSNSAEELADLLEQLGCRDRWRRATECARVNVEKSE